MEIYGRDGGRPSAVGRESQLSSSGRARSSVSVCLGKRERARASMCETSTKAQRARAATARISWPTCG